MSGVPLEPPRRSGADPALKFLGGCALVVGGLAAVVLLIGSFVGWRLVRDETPGRPEEPFLTSNDTSYWCFDLRPDDPALVGLAEHMQSEAERTRTEALKGSPLAGFPFPHRRAELDRLLPLRVELAASPETARGGRSGWTARLALSKALFRVRAATRLMSWFATRDPKNGERLDADGVPLTVVHGQQGVDLSFAMVGNRFLAASDPDRLRTILTSVTHPTIEGIVAFPAPEQRHAAVRRDGETGWGIEDRFEVQDRDTNRAIETATASFQIGSDASVTVSVRADGALDDLGPDGARAIVARFIPGIDPAQVVLADGSPKPHGPGSWSIEGKVAEIHTHLFAPLIRAIERAEEEKTRRVSDREPGRETPSATPTPPSPSPRSGPRSGTREAPPHAGTPSPGR